MAPSKGIARWAAASSSHSRPCCCATRRLRRVSTSTNTAMKNHATPNPPNIPRQTTNATSSHNTQKRTTKMARAMRSSFSRGMRARSRMRHTTVTGSATASTATTIMMV